uniref:Uncharacterized protein n=1 Tax=Strix occidentalis caurina TaxID=311401 RepID=A0A8D0KWL0_STROC
PPPYLQGADLLLGEVVGRGALGAEPAEVGERDVDEVLQQPALLQRAPHGRQAPRRRARPRPPAARRRLATAPLLPLQHAGGSQGSRSIHASASGRPGRRGGGGGGSNSREGGRAAGGSLRLAAPRLSSPGNYRVLTCTTGRQRGCGRSAQAAAAPPRRLSLSAPASASQRPPPASHRLPQLPPQRPPQPFSARLSPSAPASSLSPPPSAPASSLSPPPSAPASAPASAPLRPPQPFSPSPRASQRPHRPLTTRLSPSVPARLNIPSCRLSTSLSLSPPASAAHRPLSPPHFPQVWRDLQLGLEESAAPVH